MKNVLLEILSHSRTRTQTPGFIWIGGAGYITNTHHMMAAEHKTTLEFKKIELQLIKQTIMSLLILTVCAE